MKFSTDLEVTKDGVVWKGLSPFTIGICDPDTGEVIESFTAKPGEAIPFRWMDIWRESLKEGNPPLEIDDRGKWDPSLLKQALGKRGH